MRQCKCGSYAINDDPKRAACDSCWRDAKIAALESEVKRLRLWLLGIMGQLNELTGARPIDSADLTQWYGIVLFSDNDFDGLYFVDTEDDVVDWCSTDFIEWVVKPEALEKGGEE